MSARVQAEPLCVFDRSALAERLPLVDQVLHPGDALLELIVTQA